MEYLWDIRYVTETAMNPRGASPSESRQLVVPQMAPRKSGNWDKHSNATRSMCAFFNQYTGYIKTNKCNWKSGKNTYNSIDSVDVWKRLFQGKNSLRNDLHHLNESL